MHKAINAKIEQHESVMNMLKGTGNRRLMFAAQDTHWGVGPDNNGRVYFDRSQKNCLITDNTVEPR